MHVTVFSIIQSSGKIKTIIKLKSNCITKIFNVALTDVLYMINLLNISINIKGIFLIKTKI